MQTQRDSERSPGDGRQGLEGGSYKPRTSEVSSHHQKLEGEGRTLSYTSWKDHDDDDNLPTP